MQIIPVSTSVSHSLTFRADHAGKYINKGFIHTVHTMLVSTSVNYSLVSTSVSYSPIVPYTVQIMLVSTSVSYSPIHSAGHAGEYISELLTKHRADHAGEYISGLLTHTQGRSCW